MQRNPGRRSRVPAEQGWCLLLFGVAVARRRGVGGVGEEEEEK